GCRATRSAARHPRPRPAPRRCSSPQSFIYQAAKPEGNHAERFMRWPAFYGRLFTLFAALLLTIRVTTMGLRVRRMRLTLSFLIATAISGLVLQQAAASDLYREAPPLLRSEEHTS